MPATNLSVALPFLGQPTVRVRRAPGTDKLLVVLQDVFTKLGGVSSANAAQRIKTARENVGRDVQVIKVREGGNDLQLSTLGVAVDLLVEIKTPASRDLRHQLIELGKAVVSGDIDGRVAADIQSNKEWLQSMPKAQQELFLELLLPEVSIWLCHKALPSRGGLVSEHSLLKKSGVQ